MKDIKDNGNVQGEPRAYTTERKQMNDIEIVLICDDGYIVPTLTTVFSLFQSKNANSAYKVHIIANTLNEEKYEIFNSLEDENFIIDIVMINESKVFELAGSMKDSFCVATPSALLKFFIPQIINVQKVLYLDGDILVKKDLSDLYSIDIGNYFGGAVIDSSKLYSNRPIVKEKNSYFNSGVMLLNLVKMASVINDLIITKKEQPDQTLMDQDVFNIVIGNNIVNLPIKYNFLYTNLIRAKKNYTIKDLNILYGTHYKSLREIYVDASIIHYASKDKPWKCVESPMARKWYKNYRDLKKRLVLKQADDSEIKSFEKNIADDSRLMNAMNMDGSDLINHNDLIVSLTSYSKRMNYIHNTIKSLIEQSEIPDRIILWLAEEEFPGREKDFPSELLECMGQGLEVRWCENLRSHKKYFYTMMQFPENIVITVDDDVIYDDKTVSYLYKSYLKFPDSISANRVHVMGFDTERKISEYVQWPQETEQIMQEPNLALFFTGVGGVLYPPHCLHKEVFNIRMLEKNCPTTDDIWLKMMSVLNGTKTVCAYPNIKISLIEETQKNALYKLNRAGGENDRQFLASLEYCRNFKEDILSDIYADYCKISDLLLSPAVSVIIPINDNNCNMQNIESLLHQSLKSVQYIILDNGSKGNVGRKLINDERVTYLSNKNWNAGREANIGIDHAQGKYLLIGDPNIYYLHDFLKNLYYKACVSNAEITLCKVDYFNPIEKTNRSSEWDKKFFRIPPQATFGFRDLKSDRFNTFTYRVSDKLYLKNFIKKNNFKFSDTSSCYGDFTFILNSLMKAEKIAYMAEILAMQDETCIFRHAEIHPWKEIYLSLLTLKNELSGKKEWTLLKQDFDNFALAVILHEYQYVNGKKCAERYEELKTVVFEELGLLDLEEEYFYDPYLYKQMQYIHTMDYMWSVMKDCIGINNYEDKYVKSLEIKNAELNKQISELRIQNKNLQYADYCLSETRKSKSYRIGLLLTALPRKLRGGG